MDAMIEAHRSYLDRMVKKVLLLSPKSGKQVRLSVPTFDLNLRSRSRKAYSIWWQRFFPPFSCSGKQRFVQDFLLLLLKVLRYRQDNFYNYCLSESARRDGQLDAERVSLCMPFLSGTHSWLKGVYTGTEPAHDPDTLPRLIQQVKDYSGVFSERAQTIVHQLQVS